MPTRHRLSAGVFVLSGSLGLGVSAQDAICLGNLGDVDVDGNLDIVANCRLMGTEVRGNVKLFEGGSLIARDARILGNVEGKRANFVDVDESLIDGNVKLEEFVGDLSSIQRSEIHGKAELKGNRSRLEVVNNDFGGGVEVSRNRGGVVISGNSVDGDLRCSGNDPEPDGLANQVQGDTRGQCRDLESTPPPSSPPATPPPAAPPPAAPPPATPPAVTPPSPSPPPAASPPPATARPPPTSPPPATTPPPASPPPPTTSTPPASTPAPAATPPAPAPADPAVDDDGGAGALGWPVLFLLPLLALRRVSRRRGQPSA